MVNNENQPLFLAIDFGSSSIHIGLGSGIGRPLNVINIPISYQKRPDSPNSAWEINSELTWAKICSGIKRVMAKSSIPIHRIYGLGITSQRLGLVMYNSDGRELYAGPNKDMRGVFQGGEVDDKIGKTLWSLTGHGPGLLTAWARILWFKQEKPNVYENIRFISGISDWIAYRMTGTLFLESSLACDAGLAKVTDGTAAKSLATELDLQNIEFPPTCMAGTTVGNLSKQAAKQMGLKSSIPVINAGPDTQVGLFGMGVTSPSNTGILSGHTTAIQRLTGKPVFEPNHSRWTGRHIIPDTWLLEVNAGEMGGGYKWLIGLTSSQENIESEMESIDQLYDVVGPGSNGTTAHLVPPNINISDVNLRSGGFIFPVPLSFEPPSRETLGRATLESFAFTIRLNLDMLESVYGTNQSLSIGGGLTKSKTFQTVLASTLNKPVGFQMMSEATVLGTLSMTATGTNHADLSFLAKHRRAELSYIVPKKVVSSEYEDLYQRWRDSAAKIDSIDF